MGVNTAINSQSNGSLAPSTSPQFANVTVGNGGAVRTTQTDGNTFTISAYDVDGATFVDFFTFTAANVPTGVLENTITVATGADIDMAAGAHTIGASIGANTLTLGGASSTVEIPGNLTVEGTTDTQNLVVEDKNILINKGGTTAGATSAGLDIEGDGAAVVGYIRVGSSDNTVWTMKAPGGAGVFTIDINATETLTVNGSLNIAADSAIDQDLRSSATPSFVAAIFTNLNVSNGIVRTDASGTISSSTAVPNGTTATTQASGNNTTLLATTAFVTSAVAGVFVWNEVTGTTQAMSVNNGYIANNASLVTLTLPATAAIGDIMEVVGKGAGGWRIAQNAGQTIHYGIISSTTGAGGYLESTKQRDAVRLVCTTTNNEFTVVSLIGDLNTDVT